jgi:chromate transporter
MNNYFNLKEEPENIENHLNSNINPLLQDNENLLEDQEISKEISIMEIFKLSFNLGLFSFGGRVEQIQLIKNKFITERNYLREKEFEYIYSLCKIFPGNTPTQVLFALAIIKTMSLLGGIMSLIGFVFPSLFIMILISIFIKNIKVYFLQADLSIFNYDNDKFFYLMSVLIAGFCQAAVSILIANALSLTKSLAKRKYDFFIILICAILCFYWNNFGFMIFIMLFGAFASCSYGDHDYFLDLFNMNLSLKEIKYLGFPSFIIMVIIYSFLFVISFFQKENYMNIYLMESFYRIGTFNFGGGHAVIPLMLSEYSKLIEESEILNGYAIMSLLPGPLFNISAFVGCMLSGIFGGLLSSIFILLPGILNIMIVLPYHIEISRNILIQYFLRGASWGAVGCLYVAAINLFIDSCFVNYYTHFSYGVLNVLICLLIQKKEDVNNRIIIVLFFGAFFSLICKIIKSFFFY